MHASRVFSTPPRNCGDAPSDDGPSDDGPSDDGSSADEGSSAARVTNIAAYKFARLSALPAKRRRLQRLCRRYGLRGTILLAEEGVNLFVAGPARGCDLVLRLLGRDPEIGSLAAKRSSSHCQPFSRMLVKIKREIIAFGVEGVDPGRRPGRKLAPRELKRWLDEGRRLTLLDARNDYEIELGTFRGAERAGIGSFREFPAAARQFPAPWRSGPLVMFCTGGIRCEKAGPLLEQLGFADVWQLDGGILRYFEEVGHDHYQGDCFVFDQRVAVDAALRETNAAQCHACQAVLTPEEQQSPFYAVGASCPWCHVLPADALAVRLAERERALRAATAPLPGSIPYDNRRPLFVAARWAGSRLLDWLAAVAPGLSRAEWTAELARGRVHAGQRPAAADRRVAAGERYEHLLPGIVEPDVNPAVRWLHEDAALVVLDKPAPLPVHACGRFHKNTLAELLAPLYRPEKLRIAHRLDANTTGVIVFARTHRMARRLQGQWADGTAAKRYVALVEGVPATDFFVCRAPVAADAARAGVRLLDADGLAAETRFTVLGRRGGRTLLEAEPVTGRTNQIRLHLWSLGLPIVGDPTYGREGAVRPQQTLEVGAGPMCLHAARLGFRHPATGDRVEFAAPLPAWAR